MNRKSRISLVIFLSFGLAVSILNASNINNADSEKFSKAFCKLVKLHEEIKSIHPMLEKLQPIAIADTDKLKIFDYDPEQGKYVFIKEFTVSFSLPEKVRASFPIAEYDNRPGCVVTIDAFDSTEEMIIIFHEFVHCSQANTIEQKLKNTLSVFNDAMQNKNYMWELNHNFPYSDSLFVEYYSGLLIGLEKNNADDILGFMKKLETHLTRPDFEYMIWQWWKEGFARLLENRMRKKYDLAENHYGGQLPFTRISFYHGGELFINYLSEKENGLFYNSEDLFNKMIDYNKQGIQE